MVPHRPARSVAKSQRLCQLRGDQSKPVSVSLKWPARSTVLASGVPAAKKFAVVPETLRDACKARVDYGRRPRYLGVSAAIRWRTRRVPERSATVRFRRVRVAGRGWSRLAASRRRPANTTAVIGAAGRRSPMPSGRRSRSAAATMPPPQGPGRISTNASPILPTCGLHPSMPVPPDGVRCLRPSTKSSTRGKCERLLGWWNRFGPRRFARGLPVIVRVGSRRCGSLLGRDGRQSARTRATSRR